MSNASAQTLAVRVLRPAADPERIHAQLGATPRDEYFTINERRRSVSRFERAGDGLRQLEVEQFYQSSEVNPVEKYGGIIRHYADLPAGLVAEPDFTRVVLAWLGALPVEPPQFSVHHIRTVAPGVTVPEGFHRDGYRHIGMYVAARHNVEPEAARTTVRDRLTEDVLYDGYLAPGELIVFDDRAVLHYTSSVAAAGPGPAHRDVFILTDPDHSEINRSGEVL